jgi:copper(I)-binding protein
VRRLALLAWLWLGLAATAQAAPGRAGAIEAVTPWSRPAVAGGSGVGYMTLVNRGRKADALVGVESPAARKVEVHRASLTGGVMSMAPAARVEIPPGGSVSFAPGGYHLMFLGLARNLKPGDRLPATLSLASGGKLRVSFAVGSGVGPPAVGGSEEMEHAKRGHAVARAAPAVTGSRSVTKK